MKKRATLGQRVMSNILKIAYLNKITDSDLANIMEVSTATISNRRRNPDAMTLEEIDSFCQATHTTFDEIVK